MPRRQTLFKEPEACLGAVLSREAERALFALYREGDPDVSARAANDIARANMGLVWKVARYFRSRRFGHRLDLDVLVSAGSCGLAEAIARFDPARGTRFFTVASHWVMEAVRKDVMDNRTIRIPAYVYKALPHHSRPTEGEPEELAWGRAALQFEPISDRGMRGLTGRCRELTGEEASEEEAVAERRRLAAEERLRPITSQWTEAEHRTVSLRLGGMDYPTIGLELGMTSKCASKCARNTYCNAMSFALNCAAGKVVKRRRPRGRHSIRNSSVAAFAVACQVIE